MFGFYLNLTIFDKKPLRDIGAYQPPNVMIYDLSIVVYKAFLLKRFNYLCI